MVVCGYNAQIGSGLSLLLEGMASSMEEKADRLENSIQALDIEGREIDIMIKSMIGKGVIQDMFVGLNILAKHLFSEIKKELIKNPTLSIREVCESISIAFVATIRDAEEYRKELDKEDLINSETGLITKVADWVNSNSHVPNYLKENL